MTRRDFQKSKVYSWENKYIAPRSKRMVPFAAAQAFVDGVFLAHGWLFPPKVERISKQFKKAYARGCRDHIELQKNTEAWVILHELAHTLTMDEEFNGDKHGPEFVGVYIKLLEDVLGLSLIESIYTLGAAGVKFSLKHTMEPGQDRRK